ncbi:MAG: ATP-binding domain-containing protein, partial [Planctomycetaceae bacterium]|nr:ATP-binding domain-containing protein [Planctomycetaceae bacterium]
LLSRTGYRDYLKSDVRDGGEDRLANLDELISAAAEFDTEHPGASIHDFLAEVTLASPVDRWDQDQGAVTLMTLHAAKGLEFPVVFIVALEEGLLPHARANNDEKELEEERRLLFVGITRARRELYLSHCRVRTFRGQQQATTPSRFLGELPAEALEYHDRSGVELSHRLAASGGTVFPRRSSPVPARRENVGAFHLTTAAELAGAGPDGSAEALRLGATVVHPQFGIGRIVSVEGDGTRRKGTVAFTVGPSRTFVLGMAPLRVLGKASGSGTHPSDGSGRERR